VYTARNNTALEQLKNKHNVKLRKFSPEVMAALKAATMEVIAEQVDENEQVANVWRSYSRFLEQVKEYHRISEQEYYLNR
jgi:TRAP-type mannitol/chloroaromatic compound transport system substrate-binding protein